MKRTIKYLLFLISILTYSQDNGQIQDLEKIMNTHADKTQETKNQSVAKAVSQKQSGGESTFQFVDNRPESMQMRKLQEMANNSPQVKQLRTIQEMANNSPRGQQLQAIQERPLNSPQPKRAAQLQAIAENHPTQDQQPIQRRVALALDDKDTEDDMVILTNLDYALSYAGGPTVDLGKNADFSGMKKDEDLMILEHGSPGKIQKDFDAKRIAKELIGTPKKAISKDIGHIILLSCYAGVAQEGKGENSALANELASILRKNGYNLPVFGKMGAALTSKATGERAVDPKMEQKYFPIEFRLTKKYGFDKKTIKLDPKTQAKYITKFGTDEYVVRKTASEILTDHGYKPSKMTLEDKAKQMSLITTDFYKELISESHAVKALFPEFNDERVALGDIYLEG